MRRKQNLPSALGIQKENWGVAMHFSEIIKLQKNAIHWFVFYCFFEILLLNYLSKMHGFLQFSFWIPIALAKICFSRKNTSVLVGTVLKSEIQGRSSSFPLTKKFSEIPLKSSFNYALFLLQN